jgi:flagellar basal-body rod protein FlgC
MINLLPAINSTSAALEAERLRMDTISQNIANANMTRPVNGKLYERQQVVFEAVMQNAQQGSAGQAAQVARVEADPRPPRLVFNPHHPDADDNGMVAMPDINVHEEMADMIVASRSFEANLALVKTARNMALQTLAIGKRS